MSKHRAREAMSLVVILVVGMAAAAQSGAGTGDTNGALFPSCCAGWTLPAKTHVGRPASREGTIEIRGLGSFAFDPTQVQTLRKDVFQTGYFSVFDALAHLARQGQIQMQYAWDDAAGTYLVQSLNGKSGWWYDAHYAGGTFERPVVRMDEYPVKDGMTIQLYLEDPERLAAILTSFREETARLQANAGRLVLPRVKVTAPQGELVFEDVLVTAHNSRLDVLQSGVVTVLDVLLSLGEQGKLAAVGLTWRAEMDGADPVDGYFVDRIDAAGFLILSTGDCTYAHEVGSEGLMNYLPPHGHKTSHVHLTSDLKVLTSPEYVEFLWTCL